MTNPDFSIVLTYVSLPVFVFEKSARNLATRKRFLASLRITKPAGPRNRPGSLIIVEELHFVIGFESGYWLLPGRTEARSAVGNREWVLSRVHGLVQHCSGGGSLRDGEHAEGITIGIGNDYIVRDHPALVGVR